ncbi:hypothetical protein J3459_012087 [Metarhizium acridum]|uniref:uncharacterized protein n=1 Tax=Metarhizium acridum TaxID=92637 RepID=UPI001C6BC8D1|nr:hypothetical protein J3458_021976 [Metarhizium acridum]KAG8418721.1 hypothetical protein J3459_012087 [Metarhizium acridum]
MGKWTTLGAVYYGTCDGERTSYAKGSQIRSPTRLTQPGKHHLISAEPNRKKISRTKMLLIQSQFTMARSHVHPKIETPHSSRIPPCPRPQKCITAPDLLLLKESCIAKRAALRLHTPSQTHVSPQRPVALSIAQSCCLNDGRPRTGRCCHTLDTRASFLGPPTTHNSSISLDEGGPGLGHFNHAPMCSDFPELIFLDIIDILVCFRLPLSGRETPPINPAGNQPTLYPAYPRHLCAELDLFS